MAANRRIIDGITTIVCLLLFSCGLVSPQLFPGTLEGTGDDGQTNRPFNVEDFLREAGNQAETDESPPPTDDQLRQGIFWPDFDPTATIKNLPEDLPPGDSVFFVKARHPKKLNIGFACFLNAQFTCITQSLGDGNWQLEVVLELPFDRENTSSIDFPIELWITDKDTEGKSINYPFMNKNFTAILRITDKNDNPPVFERSAYQIDVPQGTPVGTVIETEIKVFDKDIGMNADLDVFCNEAASTNGACHAFMVQSELDVAPGSTDQPNFHRVFLIVEEGANKAKIGQTYGLALTAENNQLSSTGDLLHNQILTLVNIVAPKTATTEIQSTVTDTTTTTSSITTTEAMVPHFEHTIHHLRLIEGIAPSSIVLELIFNNPDVNSKSKFHIKSDPMKWFRVQSIGKLDPLRYSVLLATASDAQISRTQPGVDKGGMYEFEVEATTKGNMTRALVLVSIESAETTTSTSTERTTTTSTQTERTTITVTSDVPTSQTNEHTTAFPLTTSTNTSLIIQPGIEYPLPRKIDPNLAFNLKLMTKTGKTVLEVTDRLENGMVVPNFEAMVTSEVASVTDVPLAAKITDSVGLASQALRVHPKTLTTGQPMILVVQNASLLQMAKKDGKNLEFTLTVDVIGPNPSTASLPITVGVIQAPSLNQPPVFTHRRYTVSVPENSNTGSVVGDAVALDTEDHDAERPLNYQLIGSGSELFAVSAGTITVACPSAASCLDREQTPIYHLLLIATDSAGLRSQPAEINIEVSDRDDNAPTLDVSAQSVLVDHGRIRTPVVITTTDPDMAPNNENTVVLGGSAETYFRLAELPRTAGERRYQLKTAAMAPLGEYNLTLSVNDRNGIADSKTISIIVMDAMSPIQFQKPKYERRITEAKLVKGNQLFQLELSGAGRSSDTVYEIVRGNPGWLNIDSKTASVSVGDVPRDGVAGGTYSLLVSAVDPGTRRELAQTTVSVTVLGQRLGSIFEKPIYSFTMDKDLPVGRFPLNPTTTGIPIAIAHNSVQASDSRSKPVTIPEDMVSVSPNGELLVVPRNIIGVAMLQLQVVATDKETDRALITVYLSTKPHEVKRRLQELSKPVFNAPWTPNSTTIPIKFVENLPMASVIATVAAFDPTTGIRVDNVTLHGDRANWFTYNTDTGGIQTNRFFDYERLTADEREFTLTLIATKQPMMSEAVLQLKIEDMDDNKPVITVLGNGKKMVEIRENVPTGYKVFRIKVTDVDQSTVPLKYTLGGADARHFQMNMLNDTVVISIAAAASFDYETQGHLAIALSVVDSGGNTASEAFDVTLTDVNDNSPKFVQPAYRTEVVENWKVGATVLAVRAIDVDSGVNGRVSYRFADGQTDDFFAINNETGEIYTTAPLLNKARLEPYRFRVEASDAGVPSRQTGVTVELMVVAPTAVVALGPDSRGGTLHFVDPPIDFVLRIPENTEPERKIYTAKAVFRGNSERETAGDVVKYSLGKGADERLFAIDSTNGAIYVSKDGVLDRERQSEATPTFVSVE